MRIKKLGIVNIIVFLFFFSGSCFAQIVTDGSLGTSGALVISGPDYAIDSNLGEIHGNNLFHSFSTFNVNTSESATFSGPVNINNIISRVTGGSGSWIDGSLASSIDGANLFFLNPAGIMFGPNASLDLSGSFHASTADYLVLGSNGRFDAASPENSVLTTAPPSAFGFLGNNHGDIETQNANLQGADVSSVSLIANNIYIQDGRIQVVDGQISLLAPASAGEVLTNADVVTGDLSEFSQKGDIRLSNASEVFAFGSQGQGVFIRGGEIVVSDSSWVLSKTESDDALAGGEININADSLSVESGSWVNSESYGQSDAGDVLVNVAEDIVVTGANLGFASKIGSTANAEGTTGKVSLVSNRLDIVGGAKMISVASSVGDSKAIFVDSEFVQIDGVDSGIQNVSLGAGGSGAITVESDSLEISQGLIKTLASGAGDAGDVSLLTNDIVLSNSAQIGSDVTGTGTAGAVAIESQTLSIQGGSRILSNNLNETGQINNVVIEAKESLIIDGLSTDEQRSGLQAEGGYVLAENGEVKGITVNTPYLEMNSGSSINTSTLSSNRAGSVILNADRLALKEDALIKGSTTFSGRGGDITVHSKESVELSGASNIQSEALIGGDSGNISITSPELRLIERSKISASNGLSGATGDITLNVDVLELDTISQITSVTNGDSPGGNINVVDGSSVVVSGGSGLSALSNTGGGAAGVITLDAQNVTFEENSGAVLSTFGGGNGGELNIESETLRLLSGAKLESRTFSTGDGGDVRVITNNIVIDGENTPIDSPSGILVTSEGADVDGHGSAGNIYIEADRLEMLNNASIDASTTTSGQGGDITIALTGDLTLTGTSNIFANATASGDAGRIDLESATLHLSDDVIIETRTIDDGAAGNVEIETGELVMTDSSQIGSTSGILDVDTNAIRFGSGSAGTVAITASRRVFVESDNKNDIRSGIFTQTVAQGNENSPSGSIQIETPSLHVEGGRIRADTGGDHNAGVIQLVGENVLLSEGGEISSDVGITENDQLFVGNGQGGALEITLTGDITLVGKGSVITTNSHGIGVGGDIRINANSLKLTDNSSIELEVRGRVMLAVLVLC